MIKRVSRFLRLNRQEQTENSVRVGDILCSPTADYMILKLLGTGVYGEVVKCLNMNTKQTVAVKILKNLHAAKVAEQEVSLLKIANSLNHPNILRFFEEFTSKGCECLVFEMLHRDLYATIHLYPNDMPLSTIRPIAKQLFMALEALDTVGVIHSDIKLDNIMFTKWYDLRIKLIDFGLAIQDIDVRVGEKKQALAYRAPEILLGLPYTSAIDMWSAGCVLAHLFLQTNLFRVHTEYELLRQVVQVVGRPKDNLLRAGKYTDKYFTKFEGADGPIWRLKTPKEYKRGGSIIIKDSMFTSLDELVNLHTFENMAEQEDRRAFVDLLKLLLCVDGNGRISASGALLHPFITMSHLMEPSYEEYFEDTNRFMRCCAVNLRLDNQQCNDTNAHQPDDTKVQQCDDAEAKMQKSESLTWKTAKETSSNRCPHPQLEPSTDKSHQQHESAHCSKFMRNLKAWFTNRGSP